ncbi:potassium transporter TrkG [Roseinatronobacter bogoriensis]|uniref:Potassium transporter TrkH n=1 Tax=Roseinatronobacter bogoriensis subsp. barguzinensis TaxID=441209 RepID=A0A2K8KK02_9RHOB|nr:MULTISPECIES: potassium transporter TrkG [Rhodobaca]ATX66650.1 potassium transporter TrkH [Rhodobaca barguzinensis]MBB4207830.1 trk system potassium uptake protein TrkH [Rhodobaca bogoriensis DSM 18756]TDW39864.1 trk system potassium uptake protein TrkH [Rhodobaca barguzinensis]TDY70983.1 trk system potassium uptake protein TrkH [Rhodobaca bogoriensis DSM 18756]
MPRRSHGVVILVALMGLTALAMLLPAAVGFTLREHQLARAFLYSALLLGAVTLFVHLANRSGSVEKMTSAHPFFYLSFAYVFLPVLMAVPLTEAVPGIRFVDAWFEMLSAFTTTGASILEGEVTRSLHLWRATVAWGGGLFLMSIAVALLAPLNLGGFELFRNQSGVVGASLGRGEMHQSIRIDESYDDKVLSRLADQLRVIAPVYVGVTLFLWVALSIAGNPPLVALMLAMSTLSTSGIAPEGAINGLASEMLIACFLIFALSRRLWPGAQSMQQMQGPRLHDPELRLAAVILAVILVALILRASFMSSPSGLGAQLATIWGHVFTSLSFLTTTGFISEVGGGVSGIFVGAAGIVVLGLAMLGGGVATTAGGLKLMRIFALTWQARREVSKLVYPDSVGGDGERLRSLRRDGAFSAWLFLMIFIFTLTALTALLTFTGLRLEDATIFAVAALTTTGPLVHIAGPEVLHWAELGDAAKVILALGMLLGRLELLLLLSIFWRR